MWDQCVGIHVKSKLYDVQGFKKGRCTLLDVEREEVGDVRGKSLLHLQCHFGLDTMSWARLGARVTGMDFSEKAIDTARSLANELDIPAEFLCCDLYELPRHLSGTFDIVFTTAGVLAWLPDLQGWAEVIAHFLKPNGVFYLREHHPCAGMFHDDQGVMEPRIRYPYFHTHEPLQCEGDGSYANPSADIHVVSYEWFHSMGDIINSLIKADLRIEYLHEFDYCEIQSHPFLKHGKDGMWRYPDVQGGMPLMLSIRAIKT